MLLQSHKVRAMVDAQRFLPLEAQLFLLPEMRRQTDILDRYYRRWLRFHPWLQ